MGNRELRVVVVACFLGLAGGAAYAQQPAGGATFNQLFDDGVALYNTGKYDQAISYFERARDLNPESPGPWRYLGRIAKIQRRWEDCVRYSSEAIRVKPYASSTPEVRKDIDQCREELHRPKFRGEIPEKQGGLAVIANVEGASVTVDGIKKGATPLEPFPLNPGKRQVHLERAGYFPVDIEVEVIETITVDVVVDLQADPNARIDDRLPDDGHGTDVKVGWMVIAINVPGAALSIDGQTPTPRPDGSYEATPGLHTVEVTAPRHEPWRRRVKVARGQKKAVAVKLRTTESRNSARKKALVAFGVAAVAGVSGAAFGLMENAAWEEAWDMTQIEQNRPAGVTDPPVHTRAEIDDVRARGERYGWISYASFGVAAVALGVSVYYFVQERAPERKGYELPIALVPSVSPEGVAGAQVVFTRELDW